jgi:hypothetical protein
LPNEGAPPREDSWLLPVVAEEFDLGSLTTLEVLSASLVVVEF